MLLRAHVVKIAPVEAVTIVVNAIEVIELSGILKVPSDGLSRPQGLIYLPVPAMELPVDRGAGAPVAREALTNLVFSVLWSEVLF